MKTVTAEMVKVLRERTGVGMGKCKEALDQASGDMDLAIDILRKAGMASAVKKEGRETNEGLVGAAEGKSAVAMLEMNAETDFVVKNEKFKLLLQEAAQEIADTLPVSLEVFVQQPSKQDPSISIDQYRALVMQSLGENIQFRRLMTVPKSSDVSIGIYSHMGGKIVALVVLSGGSGNESLARDIAMHVAAESPEYLDSTQIPASVKEKEAEIARVQVQGKPANIADKIIEGKVKAYCDEVSLLTQKYVRDTAVTVAGLLEREGKAQGKAIAVKAFYRWQVGG